MTGQIYGKEKSVVNSFFLQGENENETIHHQLKRNVDINNHCDVIEYNLWIFITSL